MEFLIFLVLAFVLWVAVWSLVSVFKISRLGEELQAAKEELSRQRTDFSTEIRQLKEAVKARSPAEETAKPAAGVPAAPHHAPSAQAPGVSQAVPASPQTAPSLASVLPPAPTVVAAPAAAASVASPSATHPSLSPAPAHPPSTPPPLPPQQPAVPVPPPAPAVLMPVYPPEPLSPAASTALPAKPAAPASAHTPSAAPAAPEVEGPLINWELFMGVRLLAWIGGLAAFFGVALFVKLSIENNWVPAEVRVACAFLTGLGMLVGGLVLARRGLQTLAHTLCASGIVSLYAVTFACRSHYHFEFFGLVPTFLLMVLITATAFVLAARLRAQVVALLGLLGGFLTPVLLSTGVDNPVALFGYLALLDAGLLAVALYCNWHYMIGLAAFATVLMQMGWTDRFFNAEKMPVALTVLLGFDLLFLAGAELARRRSLESLWADCSAAGLAVFSLGFGFHLLGYASLMQEPLLPLCLLLGADLCLLALSVRAPGLSVLHVPAGLVSFLWCASWLAGCPPESPLYWQLGVVLGFAVLHVAFPLVMARRRPGFGGLPWVQFVPVVALALVVIPLIRLPGLPFVLWPVMLLVDLLAIGAAVMIGSVLGVVLALVLSLIAVAITILGKPLELIGDSPGSLVLLAGFFGLLFLAASWLLLRRFSRAGATPSATDATTPTDAALLPQLPVLSALLPFSLLMMVVLRLPLAEPHAVFGLALLLSVLLCGLAALLENGLLTLVALGAVAALEWCWQGVRLAPSNASETLCWQLGFYALFLGQAFFLRRRLPTLTSPWVTAALAGPLQALLVHQLVGRTWPNDFMGLIPMLFAVPSLLSLIACLRLFPEDDKRRLDVLALFGGVSLLFLTVVIPVQLDREWITLGWAAEGAALLWLFHRIPHPGLRLTGVALLVIAFVRLTLNPAILHYHLRGDMPLFNWYLGAFGFTIAALVVSARLLAPPREKVLGVVTPPWLLGMACVLGFWLLNLEIADYFTEAGTNLRFRFSGNFARDMSYTIGWSLFALGLLMLGLRRRSRIARYAALALLAVALLKLFLHDLSRIGQIYQVIAFIVVAVVTLFASFLYLRFQRAGDAGEKGGAAPGQTDGRPPGTPPWAH